MTDTGKRFVGPLELSNVAATVLTVPGGAIDTVLDIEAVATDGLSHTFTLSIGADAVGTRYYDSIPVTPGLPFHGTVFLPLDAAEILQAFADTATGVTLTISGVETT